MPDPDLTVVVPTVGRPDLTRLLIALMEQIDLARTEVLVIDNGPEPLDPEVLPAASREVVRVIRSSPPGAARARQRGLEAARGAVTVFLDDDVIPGPHAVEAILRPIAERRCGAAGGRVELETDRPLPRWLQPPLPSYLARYERGPTAHDLAVGDYAITALFAVDTGVLLAAGGFDEALGPREGVQVTNDDVQVCRSLQQAGVTIRYVPEAVVRHQVPAARLRRSYIVRRAYWQGVSDWLLDRDQLAERPARGALLALPRLARTTIGNLRRVGRDPGTPTRVATELALACGWISAAARHRGGDLDT